MKLLLSRRDFLRAGGAGLAIGALPPLLRFLPGEMAALAGASKGRFFTDLESRTIDAAVARLIPDDLNPDGTPAAGAGTARVVDYVDFFLGAFDEAEGESPFLYAGGPSSDRNPAPDPSYCGVTPVPPNGAQPNALCDPAPLSRRRAIAWKARILGTAAVGPEGDFIRANNRLLGVGDANGDTAGLQELYRAGIADLNQFARDNFGGDYADLDPLSQDLALNFLPNQDFVATLWEHTAEGMYANPEYGGNQPPDRTQPASGADGDNRPLGWSYIGFEGDRQPLGYTIFDETSGEYCELPKHPVSTPDDGPDRAVLTSEVLDLLPTLIVCLEINGRRLCVRT